MNVEYFVENVKMHCKTMGVSVFKACRESGAGETLMDNVKRGRIPSIDRVQLLAQYFGTTTSELLGEETPLSGDTRDSPSDPGLTIDEQHLVDGYRSLNADGQAYIRQTMELATETQRYKKIPDLSKLEKQA